MQGAQGVVSGGGRSLSLILLSVAIAATAFFSNDGVARAATEPQIAAGQAHSCAVRVDGRVYCWGQNVWGESGQAGDDDVIRPTRIKEIKNAVDLVAGNDFTCALHKGGIVSCWGNNEAGQLGIATDVGVSVSHPDPIQVPGLTKVKQLTAGYEHACALQGGGEVRCWGYNTYGQTGQAASPAAPPALTDEFEISGAKPAQVHAGAYHTCARLNGDADDRELVRCVGYNIFGQLGGGTTDTSPNPTAIQRDLNSEVTDVGGGIYTTCVTLASTEVRCYGYNRYGQLGTSASNNTGNPVTVPQNPGISGVKSVDGNLYANCALETDGSVSCAGQTSAGKLGRSSTDPFEFFGSTEPLGKPVTDIDSGHEHTCAILSNYSVRCWGDGDDGELGGTPLNFTFSPSKIKNFLVRDCDEWAKQAKKAVKKKAKKKLKKLKKKVKAAKQSGNSSALEKAKKKLKKAKKKTNKKARKAANKRLAKCEPS